MSTETPATHLARLRVQFGLHYRIEQARDSGRPGYVAKHRATGQRIYAGSPPHSKASSSIKRRAAE
jgi:hypothetical protein